jgi:excisionase family DNA binding protein
MSPKNLKAKRAGRTAVCAPKPTVVVDDIRYMTIREYAAWKCVSYWTVRRATKRGEIPVERIGKTDRIPVRVGAGRAAA